MRAWHIEIVERYSCKRTQRSTKKLKYVPETFRSIWIKEYDKKNRPRSKPPIASRAPKQQATQTHKNRQQNYTIDTSVGLSSIFLEVMRCLLISRVQTRINFFDAKSLHYEVRERNLHVFAFHLAYLINILSFSIHFARHSTIQKTYNRAVITNEPPFHIVTAPISRNAKEH